MTGLGREQALETRGGPAPESKGSTWKKHLAILVVLFLVSITIKFPVWQLPPQVFNDTPGYLAPAIRLLSGEGYGVQQDGFRSPTFPLYLALLLAPIDRTHLAGCTDAHDAACIGRAAEFPDGEFALRLIVLASIFIGFGITLLLYLLGWQLTQSHTVAILFGAGYALNIATAFWELSLLTETLATFLLLASVFLVRGAQTRDGRATIALGTTLALLALCHPIFFLYFVVVALFLGLVHWRSGWKTLVRHLAPVLVIPALLIALWSTWNYFANGVFTASTVSGYVLIQMVYPVAQNAPEGYDGITQPLVGFRDAAIRENGRPAGAVHRAFRDMMDETGFTYTQVSSALTALSAYLIWHYPDAYWGSVMEAWGKFWWFAFFHYDPVPRGLATLAAGFTDNFLQYLLDILFWVCSMVLAVLVAIRTRRAVDLVPDGGLWLTAFLAATVWFAAIFSSLTTLGDNERYRVTVMPLQYGVIVFIVRVFLQGVIRHDQSGAARPNIS